MLSHLTNSFFCNKSNNRSKAKRQRSRSLRIESLESREMLSVTPFLTQPTENEGIAFYQEATNESAVLSFETDPQVATGAGEGWVLTWDGIPNRTHVLDEDGIFVLGNKASTVAETVEIKVPAGYASVEVEFQLHVTWGGAYYVSDDFTYSIDVNYSLSSQKAGDTAEGSYSKTKENLVETITETIKVDPRGDILTLHANMVLVHPAPGDGRLYNSTFIKFEPGEKVEPPLPDPPGDLENELYLIH